jgi:hypothetical protein
MWKTLILTVAALTAVLSLSACAGRPPPEPDVQSGAPAVHAAAAPSDGAAPAARPSPAARRTVPSGPLLNGSQLAAAVANRSYDLTGADGTRTRISYGADGALSLRAGGEAAEGGWAVGGDALCTWLRWPGRGRDRCLRAERQADGSLIWRQLDGGEVGHAVPVP